MISSTLSQNTNANIKRMYVGYIEDNKTIRDIFLGFIELDIEILFEKYVIYTCNIRISHIIGE